jgi:PASTA domain
MASRTATPARPVARSQRVRGSGPGSGRLVVGDYVGQLAGDAAQAVRRAGLKPGLDRSFECEPELLGQVVAQEPVAGSDLARNGMVTLYVAASGPAATPADIEEPAGVDPEPAAIAVPPLPAEREGDAPRRPEIRRRRKRGLAARVPQLSDSQPDPMQATTDLIGEAETEVLEIPPAQEWSSETLVDAPVPPGSEKREESVIYEPLEDVFSSEEFVVRADEVFAGRVDTAPAWRRAYPRRRKTGAFATRLRLSDHPWLVRAAGGMLVVWALVVLAGHSPRAHHTTAVAGVVQHTAAVWVHSHLRRRPAQVERHLPGRKRHQADVRSRSGMTTRASVAPVPARVVERPSSTASAPVPAVRTVAPPVAAAREFGPEQQHGGPFSP